MRPKIYVTLFNIMFSFCILAFGSFTIRVLAVDGVAFAGMLPSNFIANQSGSDNAPNSPQSDLTLDSQKAQLTDQNLTAEEQRIAKLFREIRCPICVAQSVAESDAEASKSLRIFIREEVAAGKTNTQIRSALSERYGPSILLRPELRTSTAFLWLAPWLALLTGIGVWYWVHRRKDQPPKS